MPIIHDSDWNPIGWRPSTASPLNAPPAPAQETTLPSETEVGLAVPVNGRPRGNGTDEVETAPDLSATLYVIRGGTASDFGRVTKDWVETNRTTPLARALGARYGEEQSKRVWWLLNSPACLLRVACDREDADAVLGWAVFSADDREAVVHYVHVQRDMRLIGIARALLAPCPTTMRYSHQISTSTFYRGPTRHPSSVPRVPSVTRTERAEIFNTNALVPRGWTFDPYAFFAATQPVLRHE